MAKVGTVNFQDENEKKSILEKYFTRQTLWGYEQTKNDEITESPIVQELYFRDRFKEITEPDQLGKELLEQEQAQEMVQNFDVEENREGQLPIAQNCMEMIQEIAESGLQRGIAQTSQEIKTAYKELENPENNKDAEIKEDD